VPVVAVPVVAVPVVAVPVIVEVLLFVSVVSTESVFSRVVS
jgi:hypothetical protein